MDIKKLVMIIIVVVCLGAAGMIFFKSSGGGGDQLQGITNQEQIWVKCSNCGAEYQMGKRSYLEQEIEEVRKNPSLQHAPPIKCKECGEYALKKAYKCPECDLVFPAGASRIPGSAADTCPECGKRVSEMKEEK